VWIKPTKIGCRGNVPWGMEKTNYSRSSTKLKNVAKIGSRYVEIIGLTKIVKNKKQQQNI